MNEFSNAIKSIVLTMYHEPKLHGLNIILGNKQPVEVEHQNGYGSDYTYRFGNSPSYDQIKSKTSIMGSAKMKIDEAYKEIYR